MIELKRSDTLCILRRFLVDREKRVERERESKRKREKTKQIKLGFIFLLSVQSQQLALKMYTSWFFGELS